MRHDEAAIAATDRDETPAPLRRRKAHIRESNEAHLLACAEAVFAERGLAGAPPPQIAGRARVAKGHLDYNLTPPRARYRRVLDDLFEDWHRAAGSFEADDDPVEAISSYVRAKMTLSQRRPLGSKVWANEIIHGAEHMQDILSQRVKPWFDARVRVIEGWIARGLLAPIDPHALMYLIWATTQHYADFDAQIRALSGKRAFTKKAFDEKTEQVVQLVIRACGAVSPNAKP